MLVEYDVVAFKRVEFLIPLLGRYTYSFIYVQVLLCEGDERCQPLRTTINYFGQREANGLAPSFCASFPL